MVEKIDRPDAPPAYRITETKQTKEDQHHGQQPREDAEKQLRKQLESKEWGKFRQSTITIKPLRMKQSQIARCLFRAVTLRSGTAILIVDVTTKNGEAIPGALILLAKLEDYFKLKLFRPGQDVPSEYWARTGEDVEMGIPQTTSAVGNLPGVSLEGGQRESTLIPEKKRASPLAMMGMVNTTTGKFEWAGLVGILIASAIVVLMIVYATS